MDTTKITYITKEMHDQIRKAKKKKSHVAILDINGNAVVSGVVTGAYSQFPDKGVHMYYVNGVTKSNHHFDEAFMVKHPPLLNEYDKAVHDIESAFMAAILVSSNDQDRAHSVAKSHASDLVNSIIEATIERIDQIEADASDY